MSRARKHSLRWVALLATVALAGSISASNAGAAGNFPSVNQPGVTDKEIDVGGVVTVTNSVTGASYGGAFDGVAAYFAYINATEKGVYGRKLVLKSKRDDNFGNNRAEVQGLLGDNVFAALPLATNLFSGAQLLVDAKIPSFGWDIQCEFGCEENTPGPPNLFGSAGSFICFTCGDQGPNQYLAKTLHRNNVGIVAYNVKQSADCATGAKKAFAATKAAQVVFEDNSLVFGSPDFKNTVSEMKAKKVNFIISCIDFNGDLNLIKEMKLQGLDALQTFPNAYEHKFVGENQQFLNGNYLFTLFAPPFEQKTRGGELYKKWLKKTGGKDSENSVFGWINADLFVTGLKAAGPDFTQQKVIDAINKMTNYTAKGLLAGVDWTKAHTQGSTCFSILKIDNGKFKPAFGKPGKAFTCFDPKATTLKPTFT